MSAPVQLVPVSHPDAAEIASKAVVEIGPGRFVRHQQVVYTGIFLNEISRMDIDQLTFTADFYVWMRFARGQAKLARTRPISNSQRSCVAASMHSTRQQG